MAYKKKSKKKQQVETVLAHVKASFNNTLVSITTLDGDVVMKSSAGSLENFKGTRKGKGTPFAATQIGHFLAQKLADLGTRYVEFNLQGPGAGRDSVVRAFQSSGLRVTVLRDVTPLPHNGCRAPKKRRV